jgi:uncharacterized Zn-binding protein involved in type VI secretion
MPGIARQDDTVETGHECDDITTIAEGSNNVLINGRGATYLGAQLAPHTITNPASNPPCIPHLAQVNSGYAKVLVNGKLIARIGDSADLGSITDGSVNVLTTG